MKAFENIEQDELPNTESLSKTTISLPFHLNLQKNDFHRIHTVIQQARNI
jgi:dTDP-4-amino-4,6-dideoxygalactose transaminase